MNPNPPLPYPPEAEELVHGLDFEFQADKTPDADTETAIVEQMSEYDEGAEVPSRIKEMYHTLQFQLCELHRTGQIFFPELCMRIIWLQHLFEEELTFVPEEDVFNRYLNSEHMKNHAEFRAFAFEAVETIFKNEASKPVSNGHHLMLLRSLFTWMANCAIHEKRDSQVIGAAHLILIVTEGTGEAGNWEFGWNLENIDSATARHFVNSLGSERSPTEA